MIDLTAVIDNEEAIRKFRELRNIARNATTSVVTDADRMDYAMQRFAATLGKIGVGVSLAGLVRQIAATRGEFQQLEVAFTTLLQSKEKADALMSQMVDLAAKTPFDLKGVADGARQLLAYGFAAEDITGTLTRLGNVAAGLGLPLERLTYLYGTTAVQGRLYARDMLQFTSSGIPVLQEMAKMYGKTTEEINEMVSAGKIGFEDVKKVIEGMTNEGGQFYNLMQEQSKTITGLISNLGDALDTMFNDIGKSQEGVIAGVLQGTISLVENYQKVLDILVPLVATYGTYRAALIATAAIEKVQATITATKAILEQTKMLTRATQAQILFNKAVKANPYVLAVSALGALVSVIWRFSNRAKEAAKNAEGLARVNRQVAEQTDAEVARIKSLQDILSDTNAAYSARKKALDDLKSIVPSYHANLTEEGSLINNNTAALKAYITEFERLVKLQAAQDELTEAYKKQRQLQKELTKYEHDLAEARQYNSLVAQPSVSAKVGTSGLQAISMGAGSGVAKPTAEIENQIERIKSEISATNDIINELNNEITNTSFEEEASKTILSAIQNLTDAQNAYNEAVKAWEAAVSDGSDISVVKEKQGAVDAAKKALDEARKLAGVDEKTKKAVTKSQKELADLVLANDRALEQSRLDIMKEGLDKELAEIDFQTEQRKQAISKAREEEKEASGGKLTNEREQVFTTQMANLEAKANDERIAARKKYAKEYNKISKQITDSALSEEERKYQGIKDKYAEFRKWVETAKAGGNITSDQAEGLEIKINQAETTEALKAVVDEYGTAEDKITEIHEKAEKARQVATESGRSDLITKITQWEKDQISAIEASVIEQSDLWKQLLGDLDRMTTDQLQEAINQARQLIANSTNLSIQDTQALLGSVENAYKKLTTRNPFKALKDAYDRYRKALKSGNKDNIASAWADVQTAIQRVKKTFSEMIKIVSDLGGALDSDVVDGFNKIDSIVGNAMNAFEGFGKKGKKSTEDIIKGLSGVTGIITTIIGLFDDSARQAEIQAEKNRQLEGTWDSINYQVERYIDLLETAGGSEYFENAEKALSSIQKGIDLAIQSLTDFPTGEVDKITGILKVISFAGGRDINTSLLGVSKEDYETLKQIYEILQSGDKDAIIALKDNEDLFKLLPKWMQDLIDKLIDYDDQLKKTQEDINKDLFQTTTSDMEDAVISWLKNVKDGSDEASEYLEDAMRDALLESFKIEQLRPRLQEFYKKYAQYADTDQDNKLDLTADEISKLREEWKDIIDWSKEQTEGIRDVIGESSSLSAQTASTRGYQVMSQDEGEEMNGRLSDVQAKTGNILAAVEFVKSLSAEQLNRTTDIRDIMIQLNGNVADIRSYTRVLPTMNETLTSMNRKLDNL